MFSRVAVQAGEFRRAVAPPECRNGAPPRMPARRPRSACVQHEGPNFNGLPYVFKASLARRPIGSTMHRRLVEFQIQPAQRHYIGEHPDRKVRPARRERAVHAPSCAGNLQLPGLVHTDSVLPTREGQVRRSHAEPRAPRAPVPDRATSRARKPNRFHPGPP